LREAEPSAPFFPKPEPKTTAELPVLVELSAAAARLIARYAASPVGAPMPLEDAIDFLADALAERFASYGAGTDARDWFRLHWYRPSRPEERPDWPQEPVTAQADARLDA